ncbi:MAG: hypothetical protein A2Y33_11255 [Spirochaetes bacterium GWF1_51_8]|nr:MAG: hypothetical protein A2Y33_11255 [Spirochaetes bacterium GWF1_51_8]
MKRYTLFITLSLFSVITASCGLFIYNPAGPGLAPLVTVSGGYLSTDQFNEISPFMFRTSDGFAYLFFSSDREGNYDIYMAKMLEDGTFDEPYRLPEPVNTTNFDEIFPIVVDAEWELRYVILRITNQQTNVVIIATDSTNITNFSMATVSDTIPAPGLSGMGYFKEVINGFDFVGLSTGDSADLEFYNPFEGLSLVQTHLLLTPHFYVNTYLLPSPNGYTLLFAKDVLSGGKHQISAESVAYISYTVTNIIVFVTNITNINLTNKNVIPSDLYISGYNDIHPTVDIAGEYKIYFASDRNEDEFPGDYDLYRYNIDTFDTIPSVSALAHADSVPPAVDFGLLQDYDLVYSDFDVHITDYFCSDTFIKAYASTNGIDFWKIDHSGLNGLWKVYLYEGGQFNVHVYSEDWFGNTSLTNSIFVTNIIA